MWAQLCLHLLFSSYTGSVRSCMDQKVGGLIPSPVWPGGQRVKERYWCPNCLWCWVWSSINYTPLQHKHTKLEKLPAEVRGTEKDPIEAAEQRHRKQHRCVTRAFSSFPRSNRQQRTIHQKASSSEKKEKKKEKKNLQQCWHAEVKGVKNGLVPAGLRATY